MNTIDATTGELFALPEEALYLPPAHSEDAEEDPVEPAEYPNDAAQPSSEIGIMAGWCPNGSWSGGICRPANNERKRWMERYAGSRVLPIGETVLLGTHHSGYDKKGPSTPSMETCQDVPIYDQLMWGVRVLDLRVQFFSGASGARRFAIFHKATNGRYIEGDVLQALLRYRRDAQAYKEIVILDFHEFKGFTAAAHRELAAVIKQVLGDAIVPPSCQKAAIAQLWELEKNTVVAYNSGQRDRLFWPGVDQRWIGSNTPGKSKMGSFIREVGEEYKESGALRSVQAAYYSLPAFVPKDLSGDLMGWFAASESGGAIGPHYIINTDWSLRCRLADNVIYANAVRARQRNARIIVSSPNAGGRKIPVGASGIFRLKDGDWVPSLEFDVGTSLGYSVQLISNDAQRSSEITWGNGQRRLIEKGERLLFILEGRQSPRLLDVLRTKV